MNVLKEAVYRAVHGEGGLVFVHGEAGIGKTRLVRELGAYARSRGVQVLYGRCPALFRMDGVPPYILWKEVVKDYLETCTPEQLHRVIGYYPAEVAKLVPEISQTLRSIPQSFPISPEQEQNRLFEAVSQFITNISRETPLLVVLDDLQWTDPSSLLLLHYLARGVQRTPLLLLGAYRSSDINDKHPLSPVLTELNRERLPQSISLKRMSLDDISEMIRQILEQDDVPTEFCKMVYEKTRGNPFFAEEVIKSLKEEEVIYREENKWKIKEVSRIEFPETVKSVLKTRFARLDEECQSVLTFASFVGNDFTLEAMCALTGIEENKLLELIDKILKTGLIKEREVRGEGVCSFADILVRDVVYDEVSLLKRKKLHGVVGRALEKAYAKKIDEHFGELASHFLESGDKDKALDYFLKAGEKAQKVYANNEATSYFQSALALLEEREGELPEKRRILERLGDIKRLVGEHDACLKYWNKALVLWNQLEEKEGASRLYRKMANVLWEDMGDIEKAKENHEKALKILEAEHEKVELAGLYEDMAHMYYRTGDIPKALSLANKALEIAEKLNAYEVIASSCVSLGTIFSFSGDLKKARECHTRGLKIALDNGYMVTALRAYNNLAIALPPEEQEQALEYYEKGYELAKKIGEINHQSWIGVSLVVRYFGMGNMAKAMALAEDCVALDTKAGNLPNLSLSKSALGIGLVFVGDLDKGEQYLKEALSLAQKLKQWQQEEGVYWFLGMMHFGNEEYHRALEFLEKANAVYDKAGVEYVKMKDSYLLIWTYVELGEIEKAENLLGNLRKFALEAKDKELTATVDAVEGMLLRAQKRWEESLQFFERSLRAFEALNARRWNVYPLARNVLYEYARVYLERNQEGDRERALDLLNQALEIFQKIGAKKDVERTEAKMVQIEGGLLTPEPKPVGPIATGYADLDKLLIGGIPPSYAVVLASPSCDERDSLVKSFLEAGAKNGEVTFYVTTDPSISRVLTKESPSTFYLFVCNPQADAIVKSSPNIFTLKGVENLTEISIALTSAIRKLDPSLKGPRRICISLISDILLQHHAVQTRRWLAGLIPELRSEGFTTLAIMDPEMHPPQEVRAVLDLFEGEINIHEKETEKGLEKFLKIKKLSNQKYLEDELLLKKEDPQKRM
ncbi:tetratricopeptide repeat protein [Candidatus Bathyarchaeota archaeon]|nr:tetratricopeptide repeat protein [Candidatus Bathyarchaeota archaeon]